MLKTGFLLAGASLLLAGALGAMNTSPSPDADSQEAVRLLTARTGDAMELQGAFTGQEGVTGELRYRLTAQKQGASGRSTSRQGGAFAAPAPGVTDTLSRVQIGVAGGDRIEATLEVHQGARLIGEARLDTVLAP